MNKAAAQAPLQPPKKHFSSRTSKVVKQRRAKDAPNASVIDTDGKDVTPLSLTNATKASILQQDQNKMMMENAIKSSSAISDYFERMHSGGGFTQSVFGGSVGAASVASSTQSFSEDEGVSAFKEDLEFARQLAEVAIPTEEELEDVVCLTLTETPTRFLLDIPSLLISNMDTDYDDTVRANKVYDEKIRNRQHDNQNYSERYTQTLNKPYKARETQTISHASHDSGSQCNNWVMYDDLHGTTTHTEVMVDLQDIDDGNAHGDASQAGSTSMQGSKMVGSMVKLPQNQSQLQGSQLQGSQLQGSQLQGSMTASRMQMSASHLQSSALNASSIINSTGAFSNAGANEKLPEHSTPDVPLAMRYPSLKQTLDVMERVVLTAPFGQKQCAFRSPPAGILAYQDAKSSPSPVTGLPQLEFLWTYSGHEGGVTCVTNNKSNPDLIAVGYGTIASSLLESAGGYLLIWTLSNPVRYSKRIPLPYAPLSVDFAKTHPFMLAVSMYDGSLRVYDIRSESPEPLFDSLGTPGKNSDPTWQILWVDRGEGKGECLVTASGDGRVSLWSVKKGLEHTDLMTMQYKVKKADVFVSHHGESMCCDFSWSDNNEYFVGGGDGSIIKCAVGYGEQSLDSYSGHTGPVYRLSISPFASQIFASCGADGTVRLWEESKSEAVVTWNIPSSHVVDISWSPIHPTLITAAASNGSVYLWNTAHSSLDFVAELPVCHSSLSCISFSNKYPLLFVGEKDSSKLHVIFVRNFPLAPDPDYCEQELVSSLEYRDESISEDNEIIM